MNNDLMQRFQGRILSVDTEVALAWGIKRGEAAAIRDVLPLADSQIAATAIVRGMTVVTRKVSDMQRCGALALNPWNGAPDFRHRAPQSPWSPAPET